MKVIPCIFGNGSCHIFEFIRKTVGDELVLDNHELCLKSRSDADFTFIDGFSDSFLVFVRKVFYSLEKFRQRTILPENGISKVNK